ncbi:ATP-binding protein [Streptomyces sp. CC208A]|uniref:ATP-binding protein n=1 Tax=Streptomyces sp. CC208A TaxID=3044573 RepID=UPI0024A92553|nr:ATP-binding protein [Streptomyces sp. CC208A]
MAQEHFPQNAGRSSSPAAPLRNTVEVFLPSEPAYVKMSRRVAAGAMERWGGIPAAVADDAVLIVSELMTNAILHGGGVDAQKAVGLRIEHTGNALLVEVTDGNSKPARLKTAGGTETGGRGLLLVTRLACDWGTHNENRTTWARLSTHPQERAC